MSWQYMDSTFSEDVWTRLTREYLIICCDLLPFGRVICGKQRAPPDPLQVRGPKSAPRWGRGQNLPLISSRCSPIASKCVKPATPSLYYFIISPFYMFPENLNEICRIFFLTKWRFSDIMPHRFLLETVQISKASNIFSFYEWMHLVFLMAISVFQIKRFSPKH